ncbi:MAG TPA: Lrp/AsnC family transcriptional regulator [Bosea sp. (in: a-proteobacteria)]|nr:Lrp/AsnC family transcriptional regulator [Bosea sp. (in: a-proteobacteria)]
MDRIDRRLLTLLQEDASRTNAQLADEVGLAPSSCLRRIRRLEAAGLILRTVAILDPAKSGKGLKVIIAVELARHDEPNRRRFLELAARQPAVVQAYGVTGQTDAMLMLRVADMDEVAALCELLFDGHSNVSRYYTMVVNKTAKETTAIPL